MHKDERQEPPVVVDTDAVVNPYAMVIEFLDTNVTNFAMLRPRGFLEFASFAVILFFIQKVLKLVFLLHKFCLLFCLDHSRVFCARFVESVVADGHDERADGNMGIRD